MKRRVVLLGIALATLVGSAALAQSDNRVLQAYIDRFDEASPEVKLQILQTADMLSVEELGPLYTRAVRYVLANADEIERNVVLRDIALFAVDRIGEGGHEQATEALWLLFEEYEDNTARIEIVGVLGEIGGGNAELIIDVNGWVQAQANLYRGGVAPDQQVLRNAVRTLGELADVRSFPILLDVQLAQISDLITDEARVAMEAIPGDYVEQAIATTNGRSLVNRLAALDYFLDDEDLTNAERARVAAGVLSEALRQVVRDLNELEAQRRLRYRAAQQLVEVSYPQATETLIRHFNTTFADYDRGVTAKTWVLEAIAALGNTGTERAAQRLTRLLDLLNTYTERDRPYDTQIMLAVVTNLERLGNVVAYDAIFYVTLLDYPQRVKDAARRALDAITQ
jgi:HEAT repeat protein